MPSYRGAFGHRNQTLVLSTALSAIPVVTGNWQDAFIPLGCLIGLKVSPDLDLKPDGLGLFGRLGLVDEYADLVPHRHKISHTPFFSTLIRFVLIFGVPLVVLWIFRILPPCGIILRIFIGLSLADALHCVSDAIFTRAKKTLKPFRTVRSHVGRRSKRWH